MDKNKIIVLDRGNYTTCTVNLQGATVTSWRINNEEQLFVSRQAHSHELSNIKGGIYLVFPHFGLWSFGPKHGFVRSLVWVLEEGPQTTDTDDVFAVFSLSDDAYTQALWGYKFRLLYKITLSENKLLFRISVENLGANVPFEYYIMQHSLFRVPDVTKCEIFGLKSCHYKNLLQDEKKICQEDKDIVTISGYTNKIYNNVRGDLTVNNLLNGRILKVQRRNFSDIHLWNPGMEQSFSVPDLGNGEYKNFISIKTGALSNKPIKLEPMSSWMATNSFEIVEPRKDKKLLHGFYDFLSGLC